MRLKCFCLAFNFDLLYKIPKRFVCLSVEINDPMLAAVELGRRMVKGVELDRRSVGCFRLLLGAVLLGDLLGRAGDMRAHYGPIEAALPSRVAMESGSPHIVSLYFLSASPLLPPLLLLLSLISALLLLLGLRSRVAAFVSWLLLLSLHNRNPLVVDCGDDALRLLLFWGSLLPLGHSFALDSIFYSWRRQLSPQSFHQSSSSGSLSTLLFLSQACLWLWAAAASHSSLSWRNGTAVGKAAALSSPLPAWFSSALTAVVPHVETLLPLFLLSPLASGFCRLLASFVLSLYALLLWALLVDAHMYPWALLLLAIAVLPPAFWSFVARRPRLPLQSLQQQQYRIEVPGKTHRMPLSSLLLLILHRACFDPGVSFTVLGREKDPGSDQDFEAEADLASSFWLRLVCNDNTTSLDWRALVMLLTQVPLPSWLIPILRFTLHCLSALSTRCPCLSSLFSSSSSLSQLRLRKATERQGRKLRSRRPILKMLSVLALLTLYASMLCWSLAEFRLMQVPNPVAALVITLRLDQSWGRVHPRVPVIPDFLEVSGRLSNGRSVHLVSRALADSPRWMLFLRNLAFVYHADKQPAFSEYLCQTWNARHGGDASLISIHGQSHNPNDRHRPPKRISLWSYDCQ